MNTKDKTQSNGNEKNSDLNREENLEKKEETKDKTENVLLDELQKKHSELNDKHLRLYSEFDNFRKRTAKERIELIKYAGEEVVSALLPVLDDFERAIKSNENSEDINAVQEGVKLVYQKMKNILSQQGLKEMEIKDGEFNSDLHDAVTKIPATEEKLKGKIADVIVKGYYLNEKVIRHAKVVVGE